MENRIFFIGDSITAWNNDLKLIKNSNNIGVPGFTTTDLKWQLRSDRENFISGETAVLMIGVNDVMNIIPSEKIIFNIEKIILALTKRFKNIFFISILPLDSLKLNKKIKIVNEAIKLNKNIVFLDFYNTFTDDKGIINYLFTTDGAHLNHRGYDLFNQKLFKIIK